MKKLVVLILFMFMASVASATYVSSDTVITGNVVWSVLGGQLIGYNATGTFDVLDTIWIDGVSGSWDAIVVAIGPSAQGSFNDATGDNGNVQDWGGGIGYDVFGGDYFSEVLPNMAVGQWYQFDLSGEGTFGIGMYPSFDAIGTITVVPEPMTLALLGIGGLFLRRRKK